MSQKYSEIDQTLSDRQHYAINEISFPVTLPGGYIDEEGKLHREVTLEPMTGYEEDLLTNQRLSKDGASIRMIVANCMTRVGPYEAPMGAARTPAQRSLFTKIVDQMLVSDKTFLVILLRRISLKDGDIYRFKTQCPNENCKHERVERLNLCDLEVYPLRDPEKRVYSFRLPNSQKTVRFRHIYVYDEPKLVELRRKYEDAFLSASLWYQIIDIDGVKVNSYRDLQPLRVEDRNELRVAMDKIDGGFDLEVTVECPLCGNVKRAPMEIGGPFFIPSMLESGHR